MFRLDIGNSGEVTFPTILGAIWCKFSMFSRFNTCKESIKTGAQNVLSEQLKVIEELLAQQTSANLLLNNTIELGEKLYPTTAAQGREIISKQLQDLLHAIESIYDGISSANRELKSKLSR